MRCYDMDQTNHNNLQIILIPDDNVQNSSSSDDDEEESCESYPYEHPQDDSDYAVELEGI